MKTLGIRLFLVILLVSIGPAQAQMFLSGQQVQQRVTNLTTQIPWYTSLPQAEWAAKREGKMIFWVHMLGNLSGGT